MTYKYSGSEANHSPPTGTKKWCSFPWTSPLVWNLPCLRTVRASHVGRSICSNSSCTLSCSAYVSAGLYTLSKDFSLYINNCPTRCNTEQSIYYSASSLYMFQVSTTPNIRSTQNCNYSFRYWSYFVCSYLPPTWPPWRQVAAQYRRL